MKKPSTRSPGMVRYRAGTIWVAIMAAGILAPVRGALGQDGDFELDCARIDLLPRLRSICLDTSEPVRTPTVREMLSQTSGMFGVDNASAEQNRLVWNFGRTLSASAERILEEPLNSTPGKDYAYGGASITLAARLAEILTVWASTQGFLNHTDFPGASILREDRAMNTNRRYSPEVRNGH